MPSKEFTSLPRKIRQIILSHTFDDVFEQDVLFNDNLRVLDNLTTTFSYKSNHHGLKDTLAAPHIRTWASTLHAVHNRVISDDLPFVLDQRLGALEKEYKFELENYRERSDRWKSCLNWSSTWNTSPYTMFGELYRLKAMRYGNGSARRKSPAE